MSGPQKPSAVAHPTSGTPRFRRNCWFGVVDNTLVAHDRKNRRFEFPLDGTETAPRSYRIVFGAAKPLETYYLDGRGEAVLALAKGSDWSVDEETEVAEAAGLILDMSQVPPPLRSDGVRLEDGAWADLVYGRLALAAGTVLIILGRLEVIEVFPWILVWLALAVYALTALFSGRYFAPSAADIRSRRANRRPKAGKRSRTKAGQGRRRG